MDLLDQKLRNLSAGKILDIAAGRGDSLKYLIDTIRSFDEAVGVDISEKNIDTAREKISDQRVTFDIMSADSLSFDDNTFDLVSNINSLHHLEHADQSLKEMVRVLKPGGTFLLCDMYPDTDNELQLTHVYVHHLWAEVNRLEGVPHFNTYPRSNLVRMIEALELTDIEFIDQNDPTPLKDKETLEFLYSTCDRQIDFLRSSSEHRDVLDRCLQIRDRISSVGIAWAPQLCVLARKVS